MLDEPVLKLAVSLSDSDSFHGPLSERVSRFVESWRDETDSRGRIQCEVLDAPPEHVGLGVGTQLGMSVALALDTLFNRDVSIEERAISVGRGLRSAVGAYGFHSGGLIVENGKLDGDVLGQLEAKIALPREWRVVLVQPSVQKGLAGVAEVQAFEKLKVPESGQSPELRDRPLNGRSLQELLFERLLPAAKAQDFEQFSDAVYEYGLASGGMFAGTQDGAFLNDEVAQFVEWCRNQDVRGVGQSSWGPTVFCWLPNASAASSFLGELSQYPNLGRPPIVTSVAARGAQVELG